ncbi:hypothetical protein [Runella salmonicolor]|uniref:Uncharacterized protein n=1 Tax=Runella salmonicolor TaxID=2950278 RepID=A0ABT1FXK4_9BACT|nr:hypothetical protein [Runella salmonicolor]MCP1386506.1 hypothetical protein [Runella salmonicolor]
MNKVGAKLIAVACTVGLLLVILWPVRLNWQKSPKDNFPLTHYPMFSQMREGKVTMTYLVGVQQDQRRVYLSYQLAGTGGMNQVRKLIRKRADKNPEKLCQQVAAQVARKSEYRGVEKVKILKSSFIFDTFFNGDTIPQKNEVLCTCNVNHPSE